MYNKSNGNKIIHQSHINVKIKNLVSKKKKICALFTNVGQTSCPSVTVLNTLEELVMVHA